jgi:protein-L-isoaspartate(D-aspartate) O-methyltransferase
METVITTTTPDPVQLRAAMVGSLTAGGHLRTPAIIDAFTEAERHLFLPGTDLEAAYDNDAVPVKHDDDGTMISCISAPSIVATQLEQLGVRPGDVVFEAGSVTGYNAALLARLAGPAGHVWSVDVDEDLVQGAAAHLKAAGVANATVALGDGAAGLPGHAPFDRVQFTVGSADVPPAILSQVGPGGRLVIPMWVRGSISRSFAFERDGDGPAWTAISHKMATFVPLRKSAADDARARIPVAGDGTVTVEAWAEQDIDPGALATVLDAPGATQWTEVRFRKGDPLGVGLPVAGHGHARRHLAHARETPRVHAELQLGLHGRPRRRHPRLPHRPRRRRRRGPVLEDRHHRPRPPHRRPRPRHGRRGPGVEPRLQQPGTRTGSPPDPRRAPCLAQGR